MWNPASWVPNYPGGRLEDHCWEGMMDGILINSRGELQCSSSRILELDHATCLSETFRPVTDKAESWGMWLQHIICLVTWALMSLLYIHSCLL